MFWSTLRYFLYGEYRGRRTQHNPSSSSHTFHGTQTSVHISVACVHLYVSPVRTLHHIASIGTSPYIVLRSRFPLSASLNPQRPKFATYPIQIYRMPYKSRAFGRYCGVSHSNVSLTESDLSLSCPNISTRSLH